LELELPILLHSYFPTNQDKEEETDTKEEEELDDITTLFPPSSPYLKEALTHPSSEVGDSYDALECLGDGLVEALLSLHLSSSNPSLLENSLSEMRRRLVSNKKLGEVGEKLNLVSHLRVGRGGRVGGKVGADLVESISAALFLQHGLQSTTKFVVKNIK